MKKTNILWIVRAMGLTLGLVFLASQGYAISKSEALAKKGHGSYKVFPASVDTTWQALPNAIRDAGATIAAMDKEERYILADASQASGDSLVIFVDKAEPSAAKVEIAKIPKPGIKLGEQNWDAKIFDQLQKALTPKAGSQQ